MQRLINTHTEDGLTLSGLLDDSVGKETVIIHIHGMQANFYDGMENYCSGYSSKGLAFLTGENRGSYIAQSFASPKGGRVLGGAYEMFEESVYDIEAWIDCAQKQGYQNIWLSSHSLGCAKAAYYINRTNDQRLKGLVLISPSDNIGLVKDPEGAADHAICFSEAQELNSKGEGRQLLKHPLWGDKILSANTYINLFQEDSNTNIFHYYDTKRSWKVVNSIRLPVIAFTGTQDDGIVPVQDPCEAMAVLEKELVNCPAVRCIVIKGAEHSFHGFESQIIEQVSQFIQEHTMRAPSCTI